MGGLTNKKSVAAKGTGKGMPNSTKGATIYARKKSENSSGGVNRYGNPVRKPKKKVTYGY